MDSFLGITPNISIVIVISDSSKDFLRYFSEMGLAKIWNYLKHKTKLSSDSSCVNIYLF